MLARLPSPFTAQDAAAGFRYELSILQAKFARTQVFDPPLVAAVNRVEKLIEGHVQCAKIAALQLDLFFHLIVKQGSLVENGAPGEIRTPDRLVRSQVLYPAELRAHMQGFPTIMFHSHESNDISRSCPDGTRQQSPAAIPIRPKTESYAFEDANKALLALKFDPVKGAKVLRTAR